MTTRITLIAVLIYGIVSLGFLLSADHAPVSEVRPPIIAIEETLPNITATAWGVFDLSTGDVLYSKAATTTLPIASITKLVTAASVRATEDMSSVATVFWTDIASEGRAGNLVQGQELTYQELLFPLLLESSNDAAAVFERSIGKAVLRDQMNVLVAGMGMEDTNLFDGSGLSAANVSTVDDLGILLAAIQDSQPHVLDITSLRQYLTPDAGWHNTSPFINDSGYIGGKHGFTEAAGRTAAVVFEEQFSRGESLRIGYVVLGSQNLLGDVRSLRELIRTRGLGK